MKNILMIMFVIPFSVNANDQTFSNYLKKENNKKPKISYLVKNSRCFKVEEYKRILNLGTYKIYKSVICKKNKE